MRSLGKSCVGYFLRVLALRTDSYNWLAFLSRMQEPERFFCENLAVKFGLYALPDVTKGRHNLRVMPPSKKDVLSHLRVKNPPRLCAASQN